MKGKRKVKTTALLIVGILFLAPFWVQPCQEVNVPEEGCCCCEIPSQLSEANHEEEHQCPCQIRESHPVEGSPAVIISHHKRTPEPLLLASEIQEPTQDHITHFAGLYPDHFLLLNEHQPLYLLNSSFLL